MTKRIILVFSYVLAGGFIALLSRCGSLSEIEPVAETQADEYSYGFRPYRGCATAISKLRSNLDKKVYRDT